MPRVKPSPGKEVIPQCQCGSQVYGYSKMVTVSGHIVPGWLMLTCYKCGNRTSDKCKEK